MPPGDPARLHLSNRSVVVAVLLLGLTLALLRLFAASARVLGWAAAAAIIAGLLEPLVRALARRVPRGVALAIVAVVTLGAIGLVVYSGIGDVRAQADALKEDAPRAARELEQSHRFGSLARQFHLAEKTQTFVDDLPSRLVGGDPASALRSAATRGVAYLATSVLTLFLLVHGERMAGSALGQIKNDTRRARVTGILVGAYGHTTRYLLLTLARAVVAGVFVGALAHLAGVPAATLLGIAVAFTSLVPWFGVLVGSIPLLLLTAAFQPGRFWAVVLCLVGYQVAEALLAQRWIDRASIRIGPVLSLIAAMLGLEVYGLGGMLVALVAVVAAAAVVRELETSESRDLLQAADEVLAVDGGAPDVSSP